jgi:hypothetical protein
MLGNVATPARTLKFLTLCLLAANFAAVAPHAQESHPSAQAVAATRSLGTVKAISGKTLTLTADSGTDVTVVVPDGARLLRVEPGEKDLKNAVPLQLEDVQPGDRVLVRGKMADDGKSLLAASVIAMKKMDIAQKQTFEREEWQRHGVGGLVSAVDRSTNTITLATTALGATKNVAVHISQNTVLRRYSPTSVKFDDAKVAPASEIKSGDQLRARGTRSADGTELSADEVVSGSFRNIAGTIVSLDSSAGTLTVNDLATKKPVVVKVTSESQLRKLSPPMAQRIAARLKGTPTETPAGPAGQNPSATQQRGANGSAATGPGGPDSTQGSGDLQQILSRMPAATLADLNKGDAVMIVATAGTTDGGVTAITLLAGVEPILEASPKGQSILSPWSLSSGGEPATP